MKKLVVAVSLVLGFAIVSGVFAALVGSNVERATSSALAIGASAALVYLGVKALRRDLGRGTASGKPNRQDGGSRQATATPTDVPQPRVTAAQSPAVREVILNTYGTENAEPPKERTGLPGSATMLFCTDCGAQNPLDAKFCHRCGALLFKSGQERVGNDSEIAPVELLSGPSVVQQKQSAARSQDASSAPASGQRSSAWTNTDTAVIFGIIALVLVVLLTMRAKGTDSIGTSVVLSPETGSVSSHSSALPSNPLDGMFGPVSKTASEPATVVGASRDSATSPATESRRRSSRNHSLISIGKSAPVHTLVDASACSAFVQSDAPQQPIPDLSGLKIDRLTVYKADLGWETEFEVANRTAVGSSPNAFDGFCVSEVKVDLKLYDPLTAETWHEQADASLSATEAINSATYEIKEDTLDPPVVKAAAITAAYGMPVEAAKHVAGAN